MQKAAQLEGAVDARTVVVAKLDATDTVAGILEAADRSAAKLLPRSHADTKAAATGHTSAGLCLVAAVKLCCWPPSMCCLHFNGAVYAASMRTHSGCT